MKLNQYFNQIEAARFIGVTRQAVAARFGDRYTTVAPSGMKHQSRIPLPALEQWRAERHAAARKLLESGQRPKKSPVLPTLTEAE